MGGASKRLLLAAAASFPRSSALRLAPRAAEPFSPLSAAASCSRQSSGFLSFLPRGLQLRFFFGASKQVLSQTDFACDSFGHEIASTPTARGGAVRPWPEWSKLMDHLAAGGYFDRNGSVAVGEEVDDSLITGQDLTEGFSKSAQACLYFARDRPHLLRMLDKRDIEIIVESCSPFLFKNGANSIRRLKSFLCSDGTHVLESVDAQTFDLMRYLLSNVHISCAASDERSLGTWDNVEISTRNLLAELVTLRVKDSESKLTELTSGQVMKKHEQFSRPTVQNIEIKKGDWICPKCSFMNFARNMKCLECDEGRPKRMLTGGDWECPQCYFFNYSRNMSCLRCDCKRPGENMLSTDAQLGNGGSPNIGHVFNRSELDNAEIERKLATNDEKAARWFSKISQLENSADLSSAIDDEDFPEIMPMRKGVNRFVVSTRKTPLERRLANAQMKSNMLDSPASEVNEIRSGGSNGVGSNKNSEISQMLDRILGRSSSSRTSPPVAERSSSSSGTNPPIAEGVNNSGPGSKISASDYGQKVANGRTDPDYVPFVPSPPDMFNKHSNANNEHSPNSENLASRNASQLHDPTLRDFEGPTEIKNNRSSSEKITEFDNDFPEIMPMRRGENRFIVSNKKDRTFTSPQYKRRIAMEQANGANFVPFVPFPPDYFSKKDKQPEASPAGSSASEASALHDKAQNASKSCEDSVSGASYPRSNWSANQINHDNPGTLSYGMDSDKPRTDAFNYGASVYSSRLPGNSSSNYSETWNSRSIQNSTTSAPSVPSSPHKTGINQTARESWKPTFTGKSLEGSAVTEPDPLDMSEEAKALRWFRRAAQIKDISELSNIPDEDFPEIMPMRKGVNRFVVSKRKTPLERRLTSSQHRRNMPIVNAEQDKDSN